MEIKQYLDMFRRWGWIMVVCTLLAGLLSYVYSSSQPRVYEGVSQYLVGPVLSNPYVRSSDLQAAGAVGQTYVSVATTDLVLNQVIDSLNLTNANGERLTPRALASQVSASWVQSTQVLRVSAKAEDPESAARISNAVGQALMAQSPVGPAESDAERQQEAVNQIGVINNRIANLRSDIEQLGIQMQQVTDQTSLSALTARLNALRSQLDIEEQALVAQNAIVQSASTNQIRVLQEAQPNNRPIAPEVTRNVLAALVAGAVLGLVAMLLFEYFIDVVYTPEDLRKVTKLPFLGGVSRHKPIVGGDGPQIVTHARPETLAAESYRLLRTNLQMSHMVPSLLITSPSRGDGKTEIAANLAGSLARAGHKVTLLDANMRRPRVAQLFGLSADTPGLAEYLQNPATPLAPLPIEPISGLSIIPAGKMTTSSPELLGSQQMLALITQLQQQSDVVIIDTPPLIYADALTLAPQVEGVILAANSGSTGRDQTEQAAERLRLVGANVLGTVLNRMNLGPTYAYYPVQDTDQPETVPVGVMKPLAKWDVVDVQNEQTRAVNDQDRRSNRD
jgi:capsular exopolysaccharide synthesis family protein